LIPPKKEVMIGSLNKAQRSPVAKNPTGILSDFENINEGQMNKKKAG
jgi:hypothetical protein